MKNVSGTEACRHGAAQILISHRYDDIDYMLILYLKHRKNCPFVDFTTTLENYWIMQPLSYYPDC